MIDIISFIHWNVNPEIFQLGPFSVRWYGLLFASGFLLGYYIGESMLKSENVNQKWIDSLCSWFFFISHKLHSIFRCDIILFFFFLG